jgi:hypothetical protein
VVREKLNLFPYKVTAVRRIETGGSWKINLTTFISAQRLSERPAYKLFRKMYVWNNMQFLSKKRSGLPEDGLTNTEICRR